MDTTQQSDARLATTRPTDSEPTDSEPSDSELATEPVAYWTGVAYQDVIRFIRQRQAELGFTQPQYWILRHLSTEDLAADDGGMTVPELTGAMTSYLRPEDDIAGDAEAVLERGWVTRDAAGRLRITAAGDRARAELKSHAPQWRAEIHAGIDDADYATTVRVLRRMMRNVGSALV
ncbi:MarR family winged helix-turn-helix transcriptional regulator [Streptomyces bambusae]|uniref:MarR family winged helix-turn-helix transcriptional regulator n=1 Tax=Streptomyces bambusae TaxID=1550616 RepID=UPI001CFE5906|nr:MarR family winged helix-turn-helix transcriptional regulator [Streptomyces bambusae]MCB5163813.1 MarR family winged helix-turn-helix transcriptional regulator [Streptomyces bambusae]